MNNRIYFDSVSTTKINPEILDNYKSLLDKYYANSEAMYDEGLNVYNLMEKSRLQIANLLKVKDNEIIFTSGASEANNLAIKGLCFSNLDRKHVITSVAEHSSVYNTFKQLEEVFNYEVDYIKLNEFGQVDIKELKSKLRDDTLLVSIIMLNNETGAINDIAQIKEFVKKHSNAYFHVDITQAIGKIPVDLTDIDLASFSAHKINGLKGSGILIKKKHVSLTSLITAGQQEFGLRGGTNNALVNIMFAKTLRIALDNQEKNKIIISKVMDYLLIELKKIDKVQLNSFDQGSYNIVNFITPIKSEIMMNALNNKGIMVSAQSTCSSKSAMPSRVLLALGRSEKEALSSIRISLNEENTITEINYFIETLKEILKKYDTN